MVDIIGAVVCLTGVAFIAHPTWLFGSGDAADGDAVEDDEGVSALLKASAVLVTTMGAAMAGLAYVCVRKVGSLWFSFLLYPRLQSSLSRA